MKREFKAQVVGDFIKAWITATAADENCTPAEVIDNYGGVDLAQLGRRISGKIVTMVECRYETGNTDFFEKEDNNFVMHPELFVEV